VALLKELIDNNLARPSVVMLKKNKRGKFELHMKDECDTEAIREFVHKKKLEIKKDTEKGYCIIYKL
jgi:hypothetical protein